MAETGGDSAATGRRCVLAAAALWSLAGAIAKGLDLDPTAIAFYRSLFAGLALLPWVPRLRRGFAPAMIPLGVVFGVMTGLYIGSIKATTAANAIFLQCTASAWTIPLSLIWLGERPDRRAVMGIGLASFGVAAIVLFSRDPGRPGEPLGIALGLASGAGFAVVMVALRALRDRDPTWLSAVGNLGGSITLGLWLVVRTGTIPVPSAPQAAILVAFGVIQMAIPYVLFARGLRSIGAPEASLIALLEPILNPVWVVLFVGEAPAPATVIGGLFLLAGVAIRYVPGPARGSDIDSNARAREISPRAVRRAGPMSTIRRKPTREVDYPDSDGKPMAETPWHRDNLGDLIAIIDAHRAGGPDYYASGNMFLYYEEGNPKRCISPDVFFVLGRPRLPERRVYKTWEEDGRGPDLVIELTSRKTKKEDIATKYRLYRDVLRVREYILFDPDGDYLKPSLQGHRLIAGEYQAMDLVAGRLTSEVVGLQFEPNGRQLNAFEPTTGRRVFAPRDAVRQERGARLRAEADREDAEAARLRAEAEVEQLRRELDAFRRTQGGTT